MRLLSEGGKGTRKGEEERGRMYFVYFVYFVVNSFVVNSML
jgi:hypothetical protein